MTSNSKEECWHSHEVSSANKGDNNSVLENSFSNKYVSKYDKCINSIAIASTDSKRTISDSKGINIDSVKNTTCNFNEEEAEAKMINISSLKNATNTNSDNKFRKFTFANEGQEKRSIIKNVLIICIAFMLLFTAFNSMSALQSSINKVDGLGTWSNTAIYASLVLSSMFLPSYIIKILTVKWTLPVSMIGYTIYICPQFYPEFYTIIPSGILVGISSGANLVASERFILKNNPARGHPWVVPCSTAQYSSRRVV